MLTLLIGLAMVGYVLALRRQFAWPVESIPLALAAGLIGALYLAALASLLRPGAYAIVAVGLCLLAFHLTKADWVGKNFRRASPGLVVFATLAVGISWRLHDKTFAGWDEFSHWGLASKVLIQTHALADRDGPIIFKDYPPGSALFHYLLSLGSGFSESRVYIAQTVLALAALTALCVGSTWLATLVVFAFGYSALFVFARGLQTMDVDHLVGLFFGCGLGSYFLSRDTGRVARLVPVVFVLPLLKSVGLLLAAFMVCAVIADQLLTAGVSRRRSLVIVLLALAPLVANRTWSHHVKSLGTPATFSLEISFARIRDSFSSDRSSERDRATIKAFSEALSSTPVSPAGVNRLVQIGLGKLHLSTWSGSGLTVAAWALVFGLLAVTLVAVQPDGRARAVILSSASWLAACGVCYALGLLVLYLYSFSEYEGVRLASFGRYFGLYFLGVGLIVMAWALNGSRNPGWRGIICKAMVAALVVGAAYAAPDTSLVFALEGSPTVVDQRRHIRQVLQPAINRAARGDRLFMVWEGSSGFELWASRYEAAPLPTNLSCWSLGPPHFEGDVWSCSLSPDQWAAMLEAFDYVVLGHADQAFWDAYGGLFKGSRNATAFKVVKAGVNSRPHLEAIEEPPTPESLLRVARDKKRVADLHEIKAALEAYVSKVGPLPTPREYGEATGPPGFWEGWWDVSGQDGDHDGYPFLDFLIESGILASVPVDPLNSSDNSLDPWRGTQYVYFVVPPGYDYEGGACEPAPDRWEYLIGITKLESEVARPPQTFSGSGCDCLWRDAPNFFQQSFDYVMCGTFRR